MSKLDQLTEENEVTREVIGKPPPRIILYGSGLILWLVIVLLIFSYIIRIPERITGPITLGTANGVTPVSASGTGLFQTLVKEGQAVQKDSPVCVISSLSNSYIIKSPAAGNITFLYHTAAVNKGDLVAAVVPTDTPAMYGRMLIPAEKWHRIRIGMPVSATIKGLTGRESISFSGITKGVSLIPEKNNYIVTVIFPQGIHLPADALASTALLEGDAQIVTGNKRLIQRIFGYFN
jgi:hypothetical protein